MITSKEARQEILQWIEELEEEAEEELEDEECRELKFDD